MWLTTEHAKAENKSCLCFFSPRSCICYVESLRNVRLVKTNGAVLKWVGGEFGKFRFHRLGDFSFNRNKSFPCLGGSRHSAAWKNFKVPPGNFQPISNPVLSPLDSNSFFTSLNNKRQKTKKKPKKWHKNSKKKIKENQKLMVIIQILFFYLYQHKKKKKYKVDFLIAIPS